MGSKDFGQGDPRRKAFVPGEVGATELTGEDAVAGFDGTVGTEAFLVLVDVDLHAGEEL